VKQFQLTLTQARPVAEAISTAGGVAFPCLDEHLMLRHLPGVFIAGEMLDWEAPTGGYLMQGCFATGTRAGQGAADWLSEGR
jgi:predicted flavoprotein YhiN